MSTHQLTRLPGVLAVLLALFFIAACPAREDTQARADQALRDANIQDVNTRWDGDARVLHLRGTVETQEERNRAEQVATQAVGTTGTVLNEIEVREMDLGAADDQIRDRLNQMVEQDERWRDRDINFDVNQGAVKIEGHVQTEQERQQIEEMVRNTQGVRDVANALEVRPPGNRR
jgi:osmotically-inducible protein OsmY